MGGFSVRLLVRLQCLGIFPSLFLCSADVFPENQKVQYVSLAEAAETMRMFSDSGLPGSDIGSAEAWDRWIREQDREVRSRIDRGVEDSISNLILFGTSFTKLPRFVNSGEAMDATEKLKPAALARVRRLAAAVGAAQRNERVEFVSAFLKRKQVTSEQRED